MKEHYDVVVVGGGVIGAAAFHRLASKSTRKVLLIDKGRIGFGSTGWSGGIVRCFHDDVRQIEESCYGHTFYKNLAAEQRLSWTPSGYLHFVYPEQAEDAMRLIPQYSENVPVEWLDAGAIRERFPMVRTSDLAGAVYEPLAAYMDPLAVSRALVELGKSLGGSAMEGVTLQRVEHDFDRNVQLTTNIGSLTARHVVCCTGAWSEALASSLGCPIERHVYARNIQLNAYAPCNPVEGLPAFNDPRSGLYGKSAGARQIHVGLPVSLTHFDLEALESPSETHMRSTLTTGAERFNWTESAQSIGGVRRFDGYTDDGHYVLAAGLQNNTLIWATGMSGGGFKFAPAVARKIEAMIETPINI